MNIIYNECVVSSGSTLLGRGSTVLYDHIVGCGPTVLQRSMNRNSCH